MMGLVVTIVVVSILVVTVVMCLVVHFTTKIERRLIYLFFHDSLRKKSLNVLKHVRRKGGTDSFDVKKQTKERVSFQG